MTIITGIGRVTVIQLKFLQLLLSIIAMMSPVAQLLLDVEILRIPPLCGELKFLSLLSREPFVGTRLSLEEAIPLRQD